MTRARAKLLKQQVNLFLSDTLIDENFILPMSYYLCMIRYEEGASIAQGGEEQLDKKLDVKLDMELAMKLDMKTSYGSAREEREACAREEDEVQAGARPGLTGRHTGAPGPRPGSTGRLTGPARRRPGPQPVPTGHHTVCPDPSPGCHPVPGPVPTGPAGPWPGRPAP